MDNTTNMAADRYTKKPVTIGAIRWTGKNLREVIAFTDDQTVTRTSHAGMAWDTYVDLVERDGLKIFTLEGKMSAAIGDWIIKGVQGEHYPCKPDIFEATYSPALAASAPAAQAAPTEPDHRSVALAAGAYTTAYSMLAHAEVHNADVDGSTKRLVAAINGLRSALGPSAPVAEDAEDAANWKWLAAYLVGPRTDRDDEIVASESVNALRKLVSAARAQAAQPEGGAKNPCPNCAGTGKTRYRAILMPSQICSECNGTGKI